MRRRTAIPLLSCAFALALAGCGSDDGTIPEDQGQSLLGVLAATEEAVSSGDCERAQEFAQEFVSQTEQLPDSVDPEVAEELTNAGTNLEDLAANPDQCATGASGFDEEQPEVSVPEEEPETTTTDETETTTEEPETTTEEPEPTEEPTPTEQEPPSGGPTQQPPSGPGGGAPPSGGVQPGGGAG
jgi:hypothetical protein